MSLLTIHQYLTTYLVFGAMIFGLGVYGLVTRRTLIGMLIAGELIFSAASLNFLTLNRFFVEDPTVGQLMALFIMALAAAEVSIALSIIIAVYRNYRSINAKAVSELSG